MERETILKQANEAYAHARSNKKNLQDMQEDLNVWEFTLEDELEGE